MQWSTALPDWERRIVDKQSLLPCGPLFPDEAEEALNVFRALRIVDVAGSPTIGECCRPWVIDFAGSVFGAYDKSTGRRMIRNFLLLVSKKNAKSTLAAGIMLTALIRNWRMSAEFVILASTIEAANNAFKPARDMVKADPRLDKLLHVQDNFRTITHRQTKANLKVVAADNESISGKKATGVLIDELWLLGKKANAENMLIEATGGLASRPEGFIIYLSTHSDSPPAGVFKQRLDYFRGVRDGLIDDPSSLGVLYEFPKPMLESQAFYDPANFYVTNPNLGASVDSRFIESKLAEARQSGESSMRSIAAKHLNVEIGISLGSDRWAGADHWERQADPSLTLGRILAESDVVTVGVDGGGLDDLLGLAVLGRHRETRRWMLWCHAWAHTSVLERRKSEASKLLDFQQQGDLVIVDNMADAFMQVADIVEQVNGAGVLASVGFDPVGVGLIVDELSHRGITQEAGQVQGVSQGFKLTGTIKTAEVQLSDRKMVHAGQALMAWCVGNAKVEPKGNAIVITKQVSGSAKIDPLMAALNAVAIMATNPSPKAVVSLDAFLAAPVMVI